MHPRGWAVLWSMSVLAGTIGLASISSLSPVQGAVPCATPLAAFPFAPLAPVAGVTPPASAATAPPSLPTPPPNLATPGSAQFTPAPLPKATAPPCPKSAQEAILQAALNARGMYTCGLHGATGDEACMASINEVLLRAGIVPLGAGAQGSNYIPSAILPGVSSGRLVQIAQPQTVPGDLEVRHSLGDSYTGIGGDEHVGVCLTYGCTQVLSNHSSTCIFSWQSSPDMCYAGSPYCGGYSDYFRVIS